MDIALYARGRVWHRDHKTVWLAGWHRVLMNTENEAPAMRHLVFLIEATRRRSVGGWLDPPLPQNLRSKL